MILIKYMVLLKFKKNYFKCTYRYLLLTSGLLVVYPEYDKLTDP